MTSAVSHTSNVWATSDEVNEATHAFAAAIRATG
jgi:hypothetical protein